VLVKKGNIKATLPTLKATAYQTHVFAAAI
jgi:hypothetical protein